MAPNRQKAEKRVDEDGVKYTLAGFKEYYGEKQGQKRWNQADDAPAPKAKVKANAKVKAAPKVKVKAKAKAAGPRKPRVDDDLLDAVLKDVTGSPAKSLELIAPIEEGLPENKHFAVKESPVPEVPEGGLLLQVLYLSPDPYMRGGMKSANGAKAGMPVAGFVCGRVLASKNKKWFPGDFLGTHAPFTTVLVMTEEMLGKMVWRLTGLVNEATASLGVGIFGMPGSTAYGGVLGVLRPKRAKQGEKSGETLFVNAASGAVGQLVGQLAKAVGATVIGSAGGPEKCKTLTEKFGFDHAIDYKEVADEKVLLAKLKELAPDGINMYFENVGGMFFDATMKHMAPGGRMAICGCISQYNTASGDGAAVSTNALSLGALIYPQIRIEGFLSSEYLRGDKLNFLPDMSKFKKKNQFEITETITEGIESFGEAFKSLFTGSNNGKVAVKVCDAKPLRKPREEGVVPATKRVSVVLKELTWEERKEKLKSVRKEGGKKGVDLEGASHMGNTQFFCSGLSEPEGDLELLLESLAAMNAPEPKKVRAHMERSGCSGHLAKMIVSASANQVAVAAYVPTALQELLKPSDWLTEVLEWYGGELVDQGDEFCAGIIKDIGGNGAGYEILARHHSTDILQKHKLMAQSDHAHDGDTETFGDDDLPGISEDRKKSIFAARKSLAASKS